VALILIILALLGFGVFGAGAGSTGTAPRMKPHELNCKARAGTGESRRDCGGPPVNP
jgi:hypothetical protein